MFIQSKWRAPEEYKDLPLNEKIDVWSVGSVAYLVLTGHQPFFDGNDAASIQARIIKGEKVSINSLDSWKAPRRKKY